MAALSSSHSPHFSLKIDSSKHGAKPSHSIRMCLKSPLSIKSRNNKLFKKHVAGIATRLSSEKGFLGRSRGLSNSQIASSVFTLGTAAVLPFYALMVIAPKAQLQIWPFILGRREYSTTSRAFVSLFARMQMQTKQCMKSSIPYIVLGILYAYLLYLSWTPDTFRLMFASKYWLPELPGMAKMFSNEMTLSSAWLHLLAIDLFAARQVYQDGLEKKIETRHSISLCLMFCPIGIVSHFITKLLARTARKSSPEPGFH